VEAAEDSGVARVVSLGTAAAIEALGQARGQAGWADADDRSAVVCCTSKGPVESWLSGKGENRPFGLGNFSDEIGRASGIVSGPRLTISAACASGLHGLIRAVMMIQTGQVARVLVVAAEASVHPLFLSSFQRLGVLPPQGELCRPFDLHRHGFLMSDAAAAVCIEAANPGDLPRGFARIDRFAMGGDATHLTGSDPRGVVLRQLLGRAVAGDPIDLVHAHGTGTVANDSIELAALESVLGGGELVTLFSHKGALGHSLGASGLVAVVLNCLSHQTGLVPGNINTAAPLPSERMIISRSVRSHCVERSLVHAAGFGGPTAAVVLSSVGMRPVDIGHSV
jgi:3-oxoacyl-[acyl-carrier-protein] synthase II